VLATLPDYEARYGNASDGLQIEALLADASSLAVQIAGLDIVRVVDDVWTGEGEGSDLLQLPQVPVTSVLLVTVDGTALAATGWRLLSHGQLRSLVGCWSTCSLIEVTYTHGFDPVPSWIVGLVCSMVQRAVRPETLAGISQQATGGQSVAYVSNAAGSNIWATQAEATRLRSIFGPRLG
jgi:hypothetical protein